MQQVVIALEGQQVPLLIETGSLGLALKQMADTSENAAKAQEAAIEAQQAAANAAAAGASAGAEAGAMSGASAGAASGASAGASAGQAAGAAAAQIVVDGKVNLTGDNIPDVEVFRAAIGANYAIANQDTSDLQRNWAQVHVPYSGNAAWIDNVLSIQNNTIGDIGFGLIRGNAAINFKDSLGIERGAIGYSRNAAHAPNGGYYPDIFYIEVGNPFTTDAQASSFRLIVTQKAGGPYWGGAAVSYFPISLDSTNGDLRFSSNGGVGGGAITFDDATYFGDIGAPEIVGFGMATTRARLRERGAVDYFTLTTNIADPQSGAAPTPDNVSKSMWEMGLGAGRDHFSVERFPAGLGQTSVNVFRATVNNFMVGQTATGAGADGRLTVTGSTGQTALTAKTTGGASLPAIIAYNNADAGDNVFVAFGVNASYAQAGNIDYNRGANQVRYNVTSDERAKVVEADVDGQDALARLLAVRIVQARMKGGATQSINTVLAHELQEVFPSAVSGERGAVDEAGDPVYQQVDFSKLIPDLVAAVQELARR